MNALLRNTQGLRICLIVNDMGEANVDAALIKDGISIYFARNLVKTAAADEFAGFKGGSLTHSQEKMVELTNGCIWWAIL